MVSDKVNWKESLKKAVIGTTVLTDYSNKTYMIDDIDFTMSPLSTFKPAFKEDVISYKDYYSTRYGKNIIDTKQFLLVSKAKERDRRAGKAELIYLIPELARATGMTDEMRNNFKLMQDLSSYTRLNPENRVKALNKFNRRIQTTEESMKVLEEWNMKLKQELITIPGRELSSETIVFGGSNQVAANPKGEWMLGRGMTLHKPIDINRWIAIYPEAMRADTEKFLGVLKTSCADMGCTMSEPMMLALDTDRQDLYIGKIQEVAKRLPKMIFVVLPTNRADRYSAVKKACLIDFGIPCQVVVKRTINHKSIGSIASKVAIQMNAKLGGQPWMIKLPVNGLMTVGFDVSHHPRDRSRSIGALVASMDLKKTGAFYSITSSYRDGNEMNVGLAHHMKKALEIYKETCDAYPDKIIFYRDGVGDGQVQYVMKQEVDPLIASLKEIYGGEEPKMAYIIVNKRTNTRVFKKLGSSVSNPKPGTVVDRRITLPDRNE
jgi:aubergine